MGKCLSLPTKNSSKPEPEIKMPTSQNYQASSSLAVSKDIHRQNELHTHKENYKEEYRFFCYLCNCSVNDMCLKCQHGEINTSTMSYYSKRKKCPVKLGSCNHAFHAHCIDQWNKYMYYCSNCKEPRAYQNTRVFKM